MAVIRNLVVKIAADISSLSKGLDNAQKKIQKVAGTFTKAGAKLTASITLPLVALGAKAVSVSAQFEQSMANAASVAGATGEEFNRMTELARKMGSKTVFSASEAADALYYMASAGYKVDQMESSLEAVLNLASATQSDLAFTTETVISTLNQYGLEADQAERVTNVFASAIGNSMASMDKLANSMGYVGPVANSLGYSIEETVGALSVLYNAGYDGSTAGTALRQSLVALMNPSSAAMQVFRRLGLNYKDLNPATNDFADILDRLAASGMDTSQTMKVFGARAGPGMLALMEAGGDAVREMTESVTGTSKASEMAAVQVDTLQGQIKLLKSEVEEICLQFGDIFIPIIRQLITKYITPLTHKIMGLTAGQKKQIVVIALLAAAVGPLLTVIGKLIGSGGTLIKLAKVLFSKAGLIIAIIGALVGAVVYLWNTNDEFKDATIQVFNKIKETILKVADAIKAWWNENGERIKAAVVKVLMAIWNTTVEVTGFIFSLVKEIWPAIQEIILTVAQAIRDIFVKYGYKIVAVVKDLWAKIKEVLGMVWSTVCKTISKVAAILKDAISSLSAFWEEHGEGIMSVVKTVFGFVWSTIKSTIQVITQATDKFLAYIQPIWEKLKGLFASLWNTIVDLYQALKPIFELIGGLILTVTAIANGCLNGIISALGPWLESIIQVATAICEIIQFVCAILRGDWEDAWTHMQNVGTNLWGSIKNLFLGMWEFIKGIGEGFVSFFDGVGINIVEIFKKCWTGISNFFTNIWNGIKNACTNIWNTITNLFGSIGDFFKNMFSTAFDWGKNLISNISEGIKNTWNKVVDGVKSIGQAIKNFLGFGSPTKEGPGSTADEWIPNLIDMMEQDFYDGAPNIEKAAMEVASALNFTGGVNQAVVGTGSSPYGDMVNGLLQGINSLGSGQESGQESIVLEIDGQRFARFIVPRLTKEYKKNGIVLKEV